MEARPSEETIERARQAIMNAPKTESGLVLPPHVAAAHAAEMRIDEAAAPTLNRAQRRANEKARRKRERKLNPEQVEALRRVEVATEQLNQQELQKAEVLLNRLAAMPPEERAAYVSNFVEGEAA